MDLATTSIAGASHHLLVRQPGQWLLTPLPAAEPVVVAAEDVAGLLASSEAPPPRPLALPVDAVAPASTEQEVEPVWLFVGLIVRGGIVVDARAVGPALLDDVDVRLVSAVDGPTSVGELAAAVGETEVRGRCRVARLVALGCLRVVEPAP